MKTLLGFIVLISLSLGACKKAKPTDESEAAQIPSNIFRGAPSAFAGQWTGKCIDFECSSQISIQFSEEKVFIQLFYVIGEKVHGLVVGPYTLANNNILNKDEVAVGSMGHGGFFITRADIGKITVLKQDSGELKLTMENQGKVDLEILFSPRENSPESNAASHPKKNFFGNLLAFFRA